jgi:hypothetical protein
VADEKTQDSVTTLEGCPENRTPQSRGQGMRARLLGKLEIMHHYARVSLTRVLKFNPYRSQLWFKRLDREQQFNDSRTREVDDQSMRGRSEEQAPVRLGNPHW